MFNLKKIFYKELKTDYETLSKLHSKEYPKYLMEIFKSKMGYKFDLNKPTTLNEIIQYLKLYDNTPIKAELTDKTKSPEYIEKELGTKKYSKEVFAVIDDIDDINNINFNNLSKRFIIKRNNSTKCQIVVKNSDKLDKNSKSEIINYFKVVEDKSFAFFSGFELQYKNIPTKYIIERLYPKIQEYQFLFSNGKLLFLTFLDPKQNILDKVYYFDNNELVIGNIENKDKIPEMLEIAKKLCKNFKLVRIDFMLVANQYLFFQEFTFTPYSGFSFLPAFNDKTIAKTVLDNLK